MGDFHFLRPGWLLLLPVGALLVVALMRRGAARGGWRRFVDVALQPFVLATDGSGGVGGRWLQGLVGAALVAAALALAGPTWRHVSVPVFRSNEALVVALDLSRSMNATDLDPSRLVRARLKLRALLKQRHAGQIGLVVFSGDAFTVTPLTTDTHNISALIPALTTDIMPSQGSDLVRALAKSASLLRQAYVPRGEILLVTDAEVSDGAVRKARALARSGIVVDVLGVGTVAGAPIPEPDGGFVRDSNGTIVVPKLDVAGLRRLADAAGGRYATITLGDQDLAAILPPQAASGVAAAAAAKDDAHHVELWSDGGRWFVLLLVPLVALAFRRGWLAVWVLCLVVPLSPEPVRAAQTNAAAPVVIARTADDVSHLKRLWDSLWQRRDQRGAKAFAAGDVAKAATLFNDEAWRGVAQYEAGAYAKSAGSLKDAATATGNYNLGNALAKTGKLKAAIKAYDRSLALAPDDADARYNKDLVERLLKRAQASSTGGKSGNQQSGQGKQGRSASQHAGQSGQSGNADGTRSDGQRPQQGGSNGASPQGQSGQDRSAQDRPGGGQQQARSGKGSEQQNGGQSESGKPTKDAAQAGDAADGDVKQWVSKQAAEQWLRRIPQDPGGLLRRKFLYQYQRLGIDQDGHRTTSDDGDQAW